MNRLAYLLLISVVACAAEPQVTVRVRTRGGEQTLTLALERYVAGVLAGESSVYRSSEALAAMAVAARTYAVHQRGRHSAEGYDFCATTHCQRLDLDAITPRLEAAASQTAGELLWFEGKPAFTPYTRDCGGRAEEAGAVWPDQAASYLVSHDDPYCVRAGSSSWQWNADPQAIARALVASGLRTPRTIEGISIAQRTSSGRAITLLLTGSGETVRISAGSFRFAIGRQLGWQTVLSDRYEVRSSGGTIAFQGFGAGHGVGLCQHGADEMGIEGRSYREILAFYYPGTSLGVKAGGIHWQRLSGESISLLAVDPQQDREVLRVAERELGTLAQRTGWLAPANLEIRVYPDLDTFRNATGEPGWVAAHAQGGRIHLQPAAVLRSRNALDQTLRHELLHVLVESQARPGLPLWFREGLVEFLAGPAHAAGPERIPSDADLRQTADPQRARRAYEDAARAVAGLVKAYGEGTVLAWVNRGLPPAVMKTSRSQAATQSK